MSRLPPKTWSVWNINFDSKRHRSIICLGKRSTSTSIEPTPVTYRFLTQAKGLVLPNQGIVSGADLSQSSRDSGGYKFLNWLKLYQKYSLAVWRMIFKSTILENMQIGFVIISLPLLDSSCQSTPRDASHLLPPWGDKGQLSHVFRK
jgi:hypothetical protein